MLRQLLLFALLAPLGAAAAGPGYATRDVELRAEPLSGAQVTGRIDKGARFEILEERKAWSQVRSGGATGWTLSFYVMRGEPAPPQRAGRRLSELFSMGTERRAETTATIGIRGLDEEELKAAQFNDQELKRLEALGVPKSEGDAFAKRGRLEPQKVDYLSPPAQ